MNLASIIAQATERARTIGYSEASMDACDAANCDASQFRIVRDAVKLNIENFQREAFKARAARGGLRHVGNSGRV